MDADSLRRAAPGLRLQAAGGYLLRDAWALEPASATRAFGESARRAGAQIRTGQRVSAVSCRSGRVEGVLTDAGPIATEAVVVAAGPWLRDLVPGLPISAGRGWLMRTAGLTMETPFVVEEMSWADQDELGRAARPPTLEEVAAGYDRPLVEAFVLVPLPDGSALLGTSLSPSLRELPEGGDMARRLAARALKVAPGLGGVRVTHGWYGLRPMTPDGMPVAGRIDDVAGLHVHGGHGSIGMMTAPAIARWLADSITGGAPSERLQRFSPTRF
jgi:glycine/D-amino acid oxidase-like deaminating enzyme